MLFLMQDSRQHIVLCAAPGSTLQQEMQLLSQASELLAASGKQHLAIFAVDPAEQVRPHGDPILIVGVAAAQGSGTCMVPACLVRLAAPVKVRAVLLEHQLQGACQAAALLPSWPATPGLVVLLSCCVLSVFPGCGGPAALTAAADTAHPDVPFEPSWP